MTVRKHHLRIKFGQKMAQIFLTIIFFVFIINFCAEAELSVESTDVVETDKGQVRGIVLKTVHLKQQFSAFKGIPYAKPPVGHGRRFRRPVPADSWKGVFSATEDPNHCSQYTIPKWYYIQYLGQEDCLYLNVYTPELNFTNPGSRAVMVWIHGGGFSNGNMQSSEYGPDFLVEKDVIVVTMNYRLGILGFLAFLPQYVDANNGLKDQVEALRWVQRNIKKFGGDPDKVTIFGESAGAASVEYHKLSPQSKDLFRASIAMSGSPLNGWAYHGSKTANEYGWYVLANGIRYWRDHPDLYNKMAREEVRNFHIDSYGLMIRKMDPLPFKPTKEWSTNDSFLQDHPRDAYRSRKFADKPHILGFMKDEGVSLISPYSCLTYIFGQQITKILSELTTRTAFVQGIDVTQRYLTTYGSAPVYYYRNSFDYDRALHKVGSARSIEGSGHADDIAHVFWVNNKNQPIDPNSDIGKHRAKMVTMWTNFAKYLKPILPDDNIDGASWEPSTSNGGFLEMSRTFKYYANARPIDIHIHKRSQEMMNEYYDYGEI